MPQETSNTKLIELLQRVLDESVNCEGWISHECTAAIKRALNTTLAVGASK